VSRIFPSIPDPQASIESLYDVVRTMKQSVELLAGQSGTVAAARVTVASAPPTPVAAGDLWVSTNANNKLFAWDGTDWRAVTV
jgi:hypothetical protein